MRPPIEVLATPSGLAAFTKLRRLSREHLTEAARIARASATQKITIGNGSVLGLAMQSLCAVMILDGLTAEDLAFAVGTALGAVAANIDGHDPSALFADTIDIANRTVGNASRSVEVARGRQVGNG